MQRIAYDRFWAEFLGVSPSDWDKPGVSIRPHAGLAGYCGLWCFRRRDRTVVSAPPGWVAHLRTRLAGCDQDCLLDESFLKQVLGGDLIRLVGPAFQGCLGPSRFRPVDSPSVRTVGAEDSAAVERFRGACSPGDWESGGLDRARHGLVAYFQGDKIVAVAGYRAWTEAAGDPCVVTHPDHRGRGCGTAVVSAVVGRALREGKLLLYQTLEANRSAVRIALRLGYEQCARHVAVRLKAETPSTTAL